MGDLGADVWCPDGIRILGTPVGTDEYVRAHADRCLEEEQRLREAIPRVADLQYAWQILLQCVGPRCHHFLRTIPPCQTAEYTQRHDEGMWHTLTALLGHPAGLREGSETARGTTTLPFRLGGLGLRSAVRMSRAAYWASWGDALPM